ncbi:hypothetical protein GCM10017673_35330 [Streptosporangium violaceochromogenes]|nr:hypothetical protein GCM10017673_35330 [Streptosporangium violaceochromogenes]
MPVPDMIRSVTRNVREAFSSREGFKEKAKELPLYVIQTTLSGVGQVLLLGDRVRNTLKRVTGQTEEAEEVEETGKAGEKAGEAGERTEDRPARREPVIFAPRPETTEPKDAEKTRSESNGAKTRPEPVIFAPAKPKPAARETTPAAEPPAETAAGTTAGTADGTVSDTAADTVAGAPAPAEPPAEPKTRKTRKTGAAPEPAGATEVEVVGTEVVEAGDAEPSADAAPAEPMPGYGGLTVASLRARMRGKSAEQIRELLAYERATTARPEVVRMYENRLAKLEAAE